jgi:hypothetical protein
LALAIVLVISGVAWAQRNAKKRRSKAVALTGAQKVRLGARNLDEKAFTEVVAD